MSELIFNKFDETDWDCYAGCEGDAKIAHSTGMYENIHYSVDVITDDNGISVIGYRQPDSVVSFLFETNTAEQVVGYINWPVILVDLSKLILIGFKKIN